MMKIVINGVSIVFHKNKRDGLYYTKLKRMGKTTDYCNEIAIKGDDSESSNWNLVVSKQKQKWPKMTKVEAHAKWGHPHHDQLNKMGNLYKVNLTGTLEACAGCAIVKSRAMATTKTYHKLAVNNGERLFIDTTGPYPKSRGGKKYWLCAVDDKSDKTWVHFANSKNQMVKFVKELVTMINGLDLKVKYIRCDNAGEHQQALQDYCGEVGIMLEYTAPNTPKQNGRVEKKIHVVWQRAMTMLINANLTGSAQKDFWAEAVACSAFIEDLIIKAGSTIPALSAWTNESARFQ